jgi:hypothetical protein
MYFLRKSTPIASSIRLHIKDPTTPKKEINIGWTMIAIKR